MILKNVKGLSEIHRKVTEEIEFLLERSIDSVEARKRIGYAKTLLDTAEKIVCDAEEQGVKNEI